MPPFSMTHNERTPAEYNLVLCMPLGLSSTFARGGVVEYCAN